MGKIILGIFTLGTLASTTYIYINYFLGNISFTGIGEQPGLPPSVILFVANSWLILGLLIFYLIFIITTQKMSRGTKWIMSIMTIVFNILAMTIVYFAYVLPERTNPLR